MKISILTPTYNRAELLKQLYTSLIKNSKYGLEIEWIVINDGSTDNTKQVIDDLQKEHKISIRYFEQENQGKMAALNHFVEKATGDFIIECDSDDYLTDNAFLVLEKQIEKYIDRKDLYALCFLKKDQNGNNMGNLFKKQETTMFDLYFKQEEDGEKALLFFAPIRKKYQYKLEGNERFSTEARMFHEMDQRYNIACINETIMICQYQENGYTKNIIKQFEENPQGYYAYFKEILLHDMKRVPFYKRFYVIKHYILFSVLANKKNIIKPINGLENKVLIAIFYFPGKFLTKKRFSKKATK